MKAAFSQPESRLYRIASSALFPDSVYGRESGGDPDAHSRPHLGEVQGVPRALSTVPANAPLRPLWRHPGARLPRVPRCAVHRTRIREGRSGHRSPAPLARAADTRRWLCDRGGRGRRGQDVSRNQLVERGRPQSGRSRAVAYSQHRPSGRRRRAAAEGHRRFAYRPGLDLVGPA